jgi:hypothetical protein
MLTSKGDEKMKRTLRLLLSSLVLAAFLLMPLLSYAGRSNGNGFAGDNGNHYGSLKDRNTVSDPVSIPEPLTLLLLGSGIAGLAGWAAVRRRTK